MNAPSADVIHALAEELGVGAEALVSTISSAASPYAVGYLVQAAVFTALTVAFARWVRSETFRKLVMAKEDDCYREMAARAVTTAIITGISGLFLAITDFSILASLPTFLTAVLAPDAWALMEVLKLVGGAS